MGNSNSAVGHVPEQPPSPPSSVNVYRRHYPKEVHQQRAETHLQFFRSASLQLHDLTKDVHSSPVKKKPRVGVPGHNLSFISLPSCPEFRQPELYYDSNSLRRPELVIVEEPNSPRSSGVTSKATSPPASAHVAPVTVTVSQEQSPSIAKRLGPITQEVLTKGLTAKFRSISSWILSDTERTRMKMNLKNKFGGSLNLDRLTTRKRKLKAPSVASSQAESSTGSQYSLPDGRIPWPIPWLTAIFLPEYPNKPPVTEKNFSIIGTIASGAFGKVYRVCLRSEPSAIFAMKVQNKSQVIAKEAIQQIKDEVTIHESLGRGTFIAGFYASWQSRSKLYTVLQYVMGYGDLYLLWRDYGPFNEDVVRIYAAEIGIALDFIHASGVIYRDLKMENIVLDEQGHVQLVDFGFSKWLGQGDRTMTICGTLQYMAPEIAAGRAYDRAVDWWSMGVLLHVLLTSRFPFPFAQVTHHLELSFQDYESPKECCEAGQSLLSQLLAVLPEERLQTLDVLRKHPFFAAINFDAVSERMMQPFDFIPRMRRCHSCNSIADRSGSDVNTDCEENLAGFAESYEFADFEYFNDKEETMTASVTMTASATKTGAQKS